MLATASENNYDRPTLPIDLPKILEGFGLTTESVDRVRLKGGVVGKATYAVLAVIGVLGVLAYKASPEDVMPIMWVVLTVFVLYFLGIIIFGLINPGAALLEGAELIRWRKHELSAKNIPHPPQTPITISDPQSSPLLPPGPKS